MSNTTQKARQLLFEALIGQTPSATAAELASARAAVSADPAACVALDELLQVIITTERTAPADWYDQLHRYAAAQLAGQGEQAEFAAIRQLLDADVKLAEEYALLYETLRAEATATLPQPVLLPAVDLSFLPGSPQLAPAQPLQPGWLVGQLQQLAHFSATFGRLFQQRGGLQQMATVTMLALVLLTGIWVTDSAMRRASTVDHLTSQPTATVVGRNDPRVPEKSLSERTNPPASQPGFFEAQWYTVCVGTATGNMSRRGCPL